jgi:hypothetical protein
MNYRKTPLLSIKRIIIRLRPHKKTAFPLLVFFKPKITKK